MNNCGLILILTIFSLGVNAQVNMSEAKEEIDQVYGYLDKISELERMNSHGKESLKASEEREKEIKKLYSKAAKTITELKETNKQLKIELEYKNEVIDSLENRNRIELERAKAERDSLIGHIEYLENNLERVIIEAETRNNMLLDKIRQLKNDAFRKRENTLKHSNVVYINGVNPTIRGNISRPKTISFDLYYYPLYDEELTKDLRAEVSVRKIRASDYRTYSVKLKRKITTEKNDDGRISKDVSYENINQGRETELKEKLEKGKKYRIHIKVKDIELISETFIVN